MTTAYEFEPTVLCEILHDLPRHFKATQNFNPSLRTYKVGIATLGFLYSSCLLIIYMMILFVNVLLKVYKTPNPTSYKLPFVVKICVCLWCGPVLFGLISECFLHQAINNSFHIEEDPLLADVRNNIQEAQEHIDKATVILQDFFNAGSYYEKKWFKKNYYFGYIDVVRGRIQSYEKISPIRMLNTTIFVEVEDSETLRFFYIICAWILLLIAGVLGATTVICGSAAAGELIVGVGALWSLISCVFGAGILLGIAVTTADACINPSQGFSKAVATSLINGIHKHNSACTVRSSKNTKAKPYLQQLRKDIKYVYQQLLAFSNSLAKDGNIKLFFMMEHVLYEIKQAEINIDFLRGGPFKPCREINYVMQELSRPVCVQGLNSIAMQFTMLNLCSVISFFILMKYSRLRRVRLGDKSFKELLLSVFVVPPVSREKLLFIRKAVQKPPKFSDCMNLVCRERNMRSKFDIIRKYQKPGHTKKLTTKKKASSLALKKMWPLRTAEETERFKIKKMWCLRKYKPKSKEDQKKSEQSKIEKKQNAEQFMIKKMWFLRKYKPRSNEKNMSQKKETEKVNNKIGLKQHDRTPKEKKNKKDSYVPAVIFSGSDKATSSVSLSSKNGTKIKGKQSGSQKPDLKPRWPHGLQLGKPQPPFFYSRVQPLSYLELENISQNQLQLQRSGLLQEMKYFGRKIPDYAKLEAGLQKSVPGFKQVHSRQHFQPRPNDSNILGIIPNSSQNLGDRLETTGDYEPEMIKPGKTNLQTGANNIYNKNQGGFKLHNTIYPQYKIRQYFEQPKTVPGLQWVSKQLPSSVQTPGIGFQQVRPRLHQSEFEFKQPGSGMQQSRVNLEQSSVRQQQQPRYNLKQLQEDLQQRRVSQQPVLMQQPAMLQQPKLIQQSRLLQPLGVGLNQYGVGLFQPGVGQQSGVIQQSEFELQKRVRLQKQKGVQQPESNQQQKVLQQPQVLRQLGVLQQPTMIQQRGLLPQSGIGTQKSRNGLLKSKVEQQSTIIQQPEMELNQQAGRVKKYYSQKMETNETGQKKSEEISTEPEKVFKLGINDVQHTIIDENILGWPSNNFEEPKNEKMEMQQIKTDVKIEKTTEVSQQKVDLSQKAKVDAQQTKLIFEIKDSSNIYLQEFDTAKYKKGKNADYIQKIQNKPRKYIQKMESDVFQRSDDKHSHVNKEKPDDKNNKTYDDTNIEEPDKLSVEFLKIEKQENIISVTNLQPCDSVCCYDEITPKKYKSQVNINISKHEPKNIDVDSQKEEKQKKVTHSSKKQKSKSTVELEPKSISIDSEIAEKQDNVLTSTSTKSSDSEPFSGVKTSENTKKKVSIDISKSEPKNIKFEEEKKKKTSKSDTKNIKSNPQIETQQKNNIDSETAEKQDNVLTSTSSKSSDSEPISGKETLEKTKNKVSIDMSKSEPKNIKFEKKKEKKTSKSDTKNLKSNSQIERQQKNNIDSETAEKQDNILMSTSSKSSDSEPISGKETLEKTKNKVSIDISESEPKNNKFEKEKEKKTSKSDTKYIKSNSQIETQQKNNKDSETAEKQDNVLTSTSSKSSDSEQISGKETLEKTKNKVSIDISKCDILNFILKKHKKKKTSKSDTKNKRSNFQTETQQKNSDNSQSESEKISAESEVAKKQKNIDKSKSESKNIDSNSQFTKKQENDDNTKSKTENIITDSQTAKKHENVDKSKSEPEHDDLDSQIAKQQENVDNSKSETGYESTDTLIEKKQENNNSKSGDKKISLNSGIEQEQKKYEPSKVEPTKSSAETQEKVDVDKSKIENITQEIETQKEKTYYQTPSCMESKPIKDAKCPCILPKPQKQTHSTGREKGGGKKTWGGLMSKFTYKSSSKPEQRTCCFVGSQKISICGQPSFQSLSKSEPCTCSVQKSLNLSICEQSSPEASSKSEPNTCCVHGANMYSICEQPSSQPLSKSEPYTCGVYESKQPCSQPSSKPEPCTCGVQESLKLCTCKQPSSKSSSKPESFTCGVHESLKLCTCKKPSSKASSKRKPSTCCVPGSNKDGICEQPSSKPESCCVPGSNIYGICQPPSFMTRALRYLKVNKGSKSEKSKVQRGMHNNMEMQDIFIPYTNTKGMGRRNTGRQQLGMPHMGMQQRGLQDPRMQQMSMQGLEMQQMDMQDMGMQHIGTQDFGIQKNNMQDMGMNRMSMQDTQMHHLGMQDMGIQQMGMQDMEMQQIGMQDMEMQQMGMQDMGMTQMNMQDTGLQQMEMEDMGMQQMDMQDFGMQDMNVQGYSMGTINNMQYYDTQYDSSAFSPEEDPTNYFGETIDYENENIALSEPTCEYGRLNPGSCIPEECVPGSGLPGSCPPGTCLPEPELYTSDNIEEDYYYPQTEMTDMRVQDAYSGENLMTEYAPNMMMPERRLSNMDGIGRQVELGNVGFSGSGWDEMGNAGTGMLEEGMGLRDMGIERMESRGEFGKNQTGISGVAMGQEGMTEQVAFGEMTGPRMQSQTMLTEIPMKTRYEMQQFYDAELKRQRISQADLAQKRYSVELTKNKNKICESGLLNTGTCYPGYCVPGSGQPGSCIPALDKKKIKMCKAGILNPGTCYPGFCVPGSGQPGSCMPAPDKKKTKMCKAGLLNPGTCHPGFCVPGSGQPGSCMPAPDKKKTKMCKAGLLNPGTCYPGFCMPGSGKPGSCMPVSDKKNTNMCKAGILNPGTCYPGFCVPGSGQPGSCIPVTNQKSALGNKTADGINASQIHFSHTIPMDSASYNSRMPNMNMATMNMPNTNMVNTDMESTAYMNTPLNMTNTDITGVSTPNMNMNMPYMNTNMATPYMNMPNTNTANIDMGNMPYRNIPSNDLPYYYTNASNTVDMPKAEYLNYQMQSESPQMALQLPQMPSQLPQMPSQSPQMPSQLPQMPAQSPLMPLQLPQIPSQSPQMPSQSFEMPSQLPQMPSQMLQMPSQLPQMPSQMLQMPSQSPQIPSQMLQMPSQSPQMPSQLPQMPSQSPQMLSQSPQMPPQIAQMPLQMPSQPPQMPSQIPGQIQVMPSELKDTDTVQAEPERSYRLPSLMNYSGAPRMFPRQDDSSFDPGPIDRFCLEEEKRLEFEKENKEKGVCFERETRPCPEKERVADDEQDKAAAQMKRKCPRKSSPNPCITCKPRKKSPGPR